jgi:hypothetical protein
VDFQGIADRLEAIVEDLDELASERIRSALGDLAEGEEPDPELMGEEKMIARARRSVAKAATILRRTSGDD